MSAQKIVVAIGPRLGGKSTFCSHLTGFQQNSFAEPLYEMLGVVAGRREITELRARNAKHEPLDALCGKSVRDALCTLGTEWGRDLIGEDVWARHLFTRTAGCPAICIDDLRFPNEMDMALKRDAVIVRLLPDKSVREDGEKGSWQKGKGHVSESHWMTFKAHAQLDWDTRDEIIDFAQSFDFDEFHGTEPTL